MKNNRFLFYNFYFVNKNPNPKKAHPSTKLKPAKRSPIAIFPACNNPNTSAEKVLKVVKPPQKPIAKTSRHASSVLATMGSNIPSRKEPIILMTNVAHGKEKCW